MHVLKKAMAPRYRRLEGLTSYLLASSRTSEARHLVTTLVQIEPGGEQRVHSHAAEQVYFVIEGYGLMTVGAETQEVGPGECVFIPSEAPHGIRNRGKVVLRYFSAAAPAFETGDLLAAWPLPAESEAAAGQTRE